MEYRMINKEDVKLALEIQGINLDDELKDAMRKLQRNVDKANGDRIQAITKIKQWYHNFKVSKSNKRESIKLLNIIKRMI